MYSFPFLLSCCTNCHQLFSLKHIDATICDMTWLLPNLQSRILIFGTHYVSSSQIKQYLCRVTLDLPYINRLNNAHVFSFIWTISLADNVWYHHFFYLMTLSSIWASMMLQAIIPLMSHLCTIKEHARKVSCKFLSISTYFVVLFLIFIFWTFCISWSTSNSFILMAHANVFVPLWFSCNVFWLIFSHQLCF